MNLEDFVIEHLQDDVSELLLHRSRWPGMDVALAADCIAARRKLRGKVPEWYADARLLFPSPLSAEQCSSSATARFKAQLALRAAEERTDVGQARAAAVGGSDEGRAAPSLNQGHFRDGGTENGVPSLIQGGFRDGGAENAVPSLIQGGFRDGGAENGVPSLIQGGFRDGGAENGIPSLIQGGFRDGVRIADLTGGLGVDSWQFAAADAIVLYNEMNPRLAEAAARNFALLGLTAPEGSGAGPGSGLRPSSLPSATGPSHSRCRGRHASPAPDPSGTARGSIECRCSEITPESLPTLLEDFRPDIVYLDPARRSSSGDKVFRLKDCSPDVLQLQDIILGLRTKPAVSSRSTAPTRPAPLMMLKLSPMADISQICRELHCVREIHCVESGGECKELLVMCELGFCGEPTVFADVLTDAAGNPDEVAGAATGLRPGTSFSFLPSEEASATSRPACLDSPSEFIGRALFEPGPALRKVGAFKLLACRFGLAALSPDAHFYLSDSTPAPAEPFPETGQNRSHSPETAGPFLETGQNRNYSPETAGPFLDTGQNRNRTPETAGPFLETGQNRNQSPETAEPFPETGQNRNRFPETAGPFPETGQFRNRTPETVGLGRWWRIADAAAFSKAAIRDFAAKYPRCADFIARGLPIRSGELASAFAAAARKASTSAAAAKKAASSVTASAARTAISSAARAASASIPASAGKIIAAGTPGGKLLLYCQSD